MVEMNRASPCHLRQPDWKSCLLERKSGGERAKSEHVYFINGMLVLFFEYTKRGLIWFYCPKHPENCS